MKQGIPYDVAFSLTPIEMEAYTVCQGILNGGNFNFDRLKWMEKGEI